MMSIPPGGEVGEEIHPDVDQVLVFVNGEGKAILNGEQSPVAAQSLCFVPAGTTHNFINTGTSPLKLYTVYAPPDSAIMRGLLGWEEGQQVHGLRLWNEHFRARHPDKTGYLWTLKHLNILFQPLFADLWAIRHRL